MSMDENFNIIDDSWIPVVGMGRIGLGELFSNNDIKRLGGTPLERIAVFKLLLAIAQSAIELENEKEWGELGENGLRKAALEYLEKNHDLFYLYGDKPFLQLHSVKNAKLKPYGTISLITASGNNTVLTQTQTAKPLDDGEKALALVQLMSFAAGGKQVDNNVVLSQGYSLKTKSGRAGPALGYCGFLHSFFLSNSIIGSIYINLLTRKQIKDMGMFPGGLGVAPWAKMPVGEDDDIAKGLKESYIGRLVPMCRFVLLEDEGIRLTEGIKHFDYSEGVFDPSVAVNISAKTKAEVIWANPEKRPWLQLTSLLSFLSSQQTQKYECYQLKYVLPRLITLPSFTIWSGGVRVTNQTGEQYVKGANDFVDSEIQLDHSIFTDQARFFSKLTDSMKKLNDNWTILRQGILSYFGDQNVKDRTPVNKAEADFWNLSEDLFDELLLECEDTDSITKDSVVIRKSEAIAKNIFDLYCPRETVRQLEAWAKNRPFSKRTKNTNNAI